jgi:hypothetical protein
MVFVGVSFILLPSKLIKLSVRGGENKLKAMSHNNNLPPSTTTKKKEN